MSRPVFTLTFLLGFAFLARVVAYYFAPGILHADEIFQYTEQAHRLVFGNGIVPWEYREGLRSWLFPGFLAGVMEASRLLGDSPRVQNGAIALTMTLLSLPCVACCALWGKQAAGWAGFAAAGILAACWSEMVLMAIHPLLDGAGTALLIPGLYLLRNSTAKTRHGDALWAGLLLGLTLAVRVQLAPCVAWAVLRVCGQRPSLAVRVISAGLVPILLSGGLDALTWGAPFQSLIRYIAVNRAGAADFYGTAPWFFYLIELLWAGGVLFIPVTLCAAWGARRAPLLLELAGVIILTFSLAHHKEFRFIFPAFPLLLTLAGIGCADLLGRLPHLEERFLAPGLALGWALLCAVNLAFAGSSVQWLRGRSVLAEMDRVNEDPHACGLAIVPPSLWWASGGFSHLRPGLALVGAEPAPSPRAGFDYAMAPSDIDLSRAGMDKIICGDTVMPGEAAASICLWHHPGGCAAPPGPSLMSPDPAFLHPRQQGEGRPSFFEKKEAKKLL